MRRRSRSKIRVRSRSTKNSKLRRRSRSRRKNSRLRRPKRLVGGGIVDFFTETQLVRPSVDIVSLPEYTSYDLPPTDIGNEWFNNMTKLLQTVPETIRREVSQLYGAFDSIVKYDGLIKSTRRQKIDSSSYKLITHVLYGYGKRFSGKYSLNINSWKNAKALHEWQKANEHEFFDPVTGNMSSVRHKGYISPLPGDIISRGGVSGISQFEHWGVYIGESYILEIVRDDADGDQADIRLNTMENFIQNPMYPAFILDTIHPHPRGGYYDTRAYKREITLWTAVQTIPIPWVFGIGIHKNKIGIYDQTCQAYVNTLVLGKAYTSQAWQAIYTAGIIAGTFSVKWVTKDMLKKIPGACITPCADTIISKGGKRSDCACISECGSYAGGSWCYVDPACGKRKGYKTYNGRYFAECGNHNKRYVCKTAKKGGHWKSCS